MQEADFEERVSELPTEGRHRPRGASNREPSRCPHYDEVILDRDDPDLAATAGHGLFHQYEYEYLNAIDVLDPRDTAGPDGRSSWSTTSAIGRRAISRS